LQCLREGSDLKLIDTERSADIAYGASRPIGDDGCGDRGALT
jgi:hypothetical protein